MDPESPRHSHTAEISIPSLLQEWLNRDEETLIDLCQKIAIARERQRGEEDWISDVSSIGQHVKKLLTIIISFFQKGEREELLYALKQWMVESRGLGLEIRYVFSLLISIKREVYKKKIIFSIYSSVQHNTELPNTIEACFDEIMGVFIEILDEDVDKEPEEWDIQGMVDGSAMVLLTLDREGNIAKSNNTAEHYLGYSLKEMRGIPLRHFFQNPIEYETLINMAERAGSVVEQKCQIRTRDHGNINMSVTLSFLQGDYDKEKGAVCIFKNIAKRKGLETKHKRQESYLASLIRLSNDSITSIDQNGIFLSWNKGAEKMFGYTEREIIGRSIYDTILPKERREELDEVLVKVREEGFVEAFETERVAKDGTKIPVSISITGVMKDNNGIPLVTMAVMRDIREKKIMEERLVRTERLKAVGELAEGVAHDFNNLLAGILGRVQLLNRQWKEIGIPQESLRYLETMESLALRGADTVRRIQEFSRQEIDSSVLGLVDINKLLLESIEVTRPIWKDRAQGRGVLYHIITRLGTLPRYKGNPDTLKETFYNLIINAIEASEQGGDILIETHATKENILISIADQGKGMSLDIKKRAFDPFFTTKGPQGSGLGLSMAYSTVVRHGGEIDLKENTEGGTIVQIRFPIKIEIPLALTYERKGRSILVIEDEEHIQDLLEEILRIDGYEVWKANSGQEGIEIFQKESIDLVLTDLGMPTITGWEVAKRCKNLKKRVPVILMTGWKQFVDPGKADAYYVDAIMEKPFKIEDILQTISCLLNEKACNMSVTD